LLGPVAVSGWAAEESAHGNLQGIREMTEPAAASGADGKTKRVDW
jgi:hypothetical protein